MTAIHLVRLNWGPVHFWAKDKSMGNRLINARSETASGKRSFRTAFKKRRCDGFQAQK
jgi:putative SOS response-associated peptidase YedK